MKEQELDNYSTPRREVKKIWNLSKVVVVPNVIGALGVKMKRLKNWLKKFDVRTSIEVLQKVALLRTTQIER